MKRFIVFASGMLLAAGLAPVSAAGGEVVLQLDMRNITVETNNIVLTALNGIRLTGKSADYNRETLEVKYRDHSIADVLGLTIDDALEIFGAVPSISTKLATLAQVGLGYLQLGQSSTTLSGGEAQRIKLAAELSKRATGRTLYLLDEPTTGLHFADVHKLLDVLMRLRDAGNTVIVIEHNLDVIKCADWVVDLGLGGGEHGGEVVACGTPEEVATNKDSFTGQFLRRILR